jgi:hypothetical protein
MPLCNSTTIVDVVTQYADERIAALEQERAEIIATVDLCHTAIAYLNTRIDWLRDQRAAVLAAAAAEAAR